MWVTLSVNFGHAPQPNVLTATVNTVRNAVRDAPENAPVRVYALGIGDEVSTALCEGIAEAGNGVCLFALTTESIIGKCARLLRAGRTPFVKDVTVDWGVPEHYLNSRPSSVNFSSRHTAEKVRLRSSPVLQQAPTQVHDIHAGIRLVVFAILKLRRLDVPKEVTLKGVLDGTGEDFTLTVPIRAVQLAQSKPGLPLVHTLAASHLMGEHEAGKAPLPEAIGPASDEDKHEAAIVRLGKRYQLASRFTSFVATNLDEGRGRRQKDFGNWRDSRGDISNGNVRHSQASQGSARVRSAIGGIFSNWGFRSATQTVPGAWPESESVPPSRASSPMDQRDLDDDEDNEGYDTAATFSTLSSLEGCSSDWSEWSQPPLSEADQLLQRSPSPEIQVFQRQVQDQPRPAAVPVDIPPIRTEVLQIIRLQLYDGSFDLSDAVVQIVGPRGAREVVPDVNPKVWATVLCFAFVMKHMGDQKELMDDLLMKAREFLADKRGVDGLLKRAKELV